MTLTEFLLARIAEDEAAAKPLDEWPLRDDLFIGYEDESGVWRHGRYDPARVLAECAAKRRIVGLHSPQFSGLHICHDSNADDSDCEELRALGRIYADHPDYNEVWRP